MTEFVEKVQIVGADGTPLTVNADGSIDITGGGGGGSVDSVVAGTNITVDATDPANPVVAAPSVIANALADAKGDIIAATAADTWARVAVGSNGQALIAASGATPGVNWAYPPGYEITYKERTTSLSVTATSEGTAQDFITCDAVTFDGGAVILSFYSPSLQAGTAAELDILLQEGSTVLGYLGNVGGGSGTRNIGSFFSYRFTPSAGSHTYKVTAFRQTANGTVQAGVGGAGAFVPAYVRITKV